MKALREIMDVLWVAIALSAWALLTAPEAKANETAIQTIMLEARGESLDGQIAVGEVIRNRMKAQNKPAEAVCLAPLQFSAWNVRPEAYKRLESLSGEVYQRASRAWAMSEGSSLTHGSRHYHTKAVSPYWSKGHVPVAVIGEHLFYNDVK